MKPVYSWRIIIRRKATGPTRPIGPTGQKIQAPEMNSCHRATPVQTCTARVGPGKRIGKHTYLYTCTLLHATVRASQPTSQPTSQPASQPAIQPAIQPASQPTTSGWKSLPKDIWLPPASMPSHSLHQTSP